MVIVGVGCIAAGVVDTYAVYVGFVVVCVFGVGTLNVVVATPVVTIHSVVAVVGVCCDGDVVGVVIMVDAIYGVVIVIVCVAAAYEVPVRILLVAVAALLFFSLLMLLSSSLLLLSSVLLLLLTS